VRPSFSSAEHDSRLQIAWSGDCNDQHHVCSRAGTNRTDWTGASATEGRPACYVLKGPGSVPALDRQRRTRQTRQRDVSRPRPGTVVDGIPVLARPRQSVDSPYCPKLARTFVIPKDLPFAAVVASRHGAYRLLSSTHPVLPFRVSDTAYKTPCASGAIGRSARIVGEHHDQTPQRKLAHVASA
jgi:hypothetical protein